LRPCHAKPKSQLEEGRASIGGFTASLRQQKAHTSPEGRGVIYDVTRAERQTARSPTLGDLALASRRLDALSLPRFDLLSSEFRNGEVLPTRSTIDGDGTPPPLSWGPLDPVPASYALICEDPDAPRTTPFVHWIVYGIPGGTLSLDANLNDFHEGLNSRGEVGFAPAAPPRGDGPHRYVFQLFALDTLLTLPAGRDYDRVLPALQGHVTVWGQLIGVYQRF
jgi:Raf kinase inhibitor-like YbhB/YbcL family protein